MNRINAAEKGATRLYFGYSSVLDREAFDVWKAEHGYTDFVLPQGKHAVLEDYALDFNLPSRWWGGRVAGLVPKEGSAVHGLLYEIRSEDWPIIEHKEGQVTGLSVEIETPIGAAFTSNPARVSHEGPISGRYLDAWAKGARAAGLPEDYVSRILSEAAS